MNLFVERASKSDISKLIDLYFQVYGNDYPIVFGSDKNAMKYAIEHEDEFLWLVCKNKNKYNKILGSTIFQLDRRSRVARVMGVAVLPKYRGQRIASDLIAQGTKQLLENEDCINAIYTTTRTLTIASQLMFLNNGYKPLGIFPNAHKIHQFETLTSMGIFREGILEKRKYIQVISEKLKPILKISNKILGKKASSSVTKNFSIHKSYTLSEAKTGTDFEFIYAPDFVNKRFNELFVQESDDHFFPFDKPNLLIATSNSDIELYAYFSKKDHYCTLIACNKSIRDYGLHLKELIFKMKDYGISYIEAMIRLDYDLPIEYLLQHQFLPSAIYPALQEKDGVAFDFILLSRTMQPLDFTGMEIDSSFKPYIDQYVTQWINMHVESLEVKGE